MVRNQLPAQVTKRTVLENVIFREKEILFEILNVSKYYYSYYGEIYSQYWENNFDTLISSILKYNLGKTNDKFITSR